MMRFVWIIYLVVFSISTITAQKTTPPLWFVQDGYIYSWTSSGSIQQVTTENFASNLALSPDGTTLAFIWQSREHPSAFGFESGNPLQTSHICIRDETSPQCITEETDITILRRYLQWLPDNQLTWLEFPIYEGEERYNSIIVTYDIEAGTMHQLENMPLMVADAGNFGFYTYHMFRDQIYIDCCSGTPKINLFNRETGEQEFNTYITESLGGDSRIMDELIVHEPEQDQLYLLYCDAQWREMDLENSVWDNSIMTIPETAPYLGLLSDSPDANTIRLASHSCDYNIDKRSTWDIVAHDGRVLDSISLGHYYLVTWEISPDGQQIAYLTDGAIHVWENGEFQEIPATGDVTEMIWGMVGWRLDV